MARLRLPGDPRAVALFRQLEERIDKFARHLPPPLDALASRQSTYLGSPGGEPFEGVAGLNPVLAGTPWLFWETFGRLDDATFITIAEGGACFVLASIVLDHLVDGQAEPPETMALFHQALYQHGVAKIRAALSSHTAFWQHFERLADEHLAGIAAELDSHTNPSRLDRASFCAMAHGKVAPVVTTIVALSEATHQPDILEPIETSLKHIAVASQLLDDIGDWQEDVEAGHVTYYLTQIAASEALRPPVRLSVEEMRARIDGDWRDVEHMRAVMDWLDLALDAVRPVECPGWVDYVEGYRSQADEHLTGFIACHLLRTLRPLVESEGELPDT